MALTAAQVQARLDAIRKARDSGVLLVRHGDTSTQFRSLAEMDQIIASLQRELDGLNGVTRSRVNYIEQKTKGYGHSHTGECDGWK
jgi:hypothetical protein